MSLRDFEKKIFYTQMYANVAANPAKSFKKDFGSSEVRGDAAVFEQERDEVTTERVTHLRNSAYDTMRYEMLF